MMECSFCDYLVVMEMIQKLLMEDGVFGVWKRTSVG